MNDVEIYDDVPRVGSYSLAEALERDHDHVRKLVEKYKDEFATLSPLKQRKLRSTGGRAATEYMFNYKQVLLLLSLMKTNPVVTQVKVASINAATLVGVIDALRHIDIESGLQGRYVYAMTDSAMNVKIGISTDPQRRLKELSAANACELKLVFTMKAEGSKYESETALHHKCSDYRIKGEWFSSEAVEVLENE